jgi:hypothetical protein
MSTGAQGPSGHKPGKGSVTVTEHEVTFKLSDDQKKQAKECMKKAGKITIGFNEITVTKLPATLDNGERID